jgi:hypothetical protein
MDEERPGLAGPLTDPELALLLGRGEPYDTSLVGVVVVPVVVVDE